MVVLPLVAMAGPDDVVAKKALKPVEFSDSLSDDALRTRKRPSTVERQAQFVPLPKLMVRLAPSVNPQVFATFYGLAIDRPMRSMENAYIFHTDSVASASRLERALQGQSSVVEVFQDMGVTPTRRQFVPNDTYYPFGSPAGYPGQWHLRNTTNLGGQNIDARVWNAWQRNATGNNVLIGIIDDGLQTNHPDLSPGYVAASSYDFGQNDAIPDPFYSNDDHGTAVAGVAAARGGNSLGVTGAAALGRLAGLRCDFGGSGTIAMFVDATLYHSSGQNTNIKIKNHSYGFDIPWLNNPQEVGAMQTSAAAGTIHVRSAGNSRGFDSEDANKEDAANDPASITVAALAAVGEYSDYSSYGANVFVTAPSSGAYSGQNQVGITTTDRTGASGYGGFGAATSDYTPNFGGTSSSAPLVAGVLAQVKQVQPALNTRFAKHLLARFSDQVNLTDSSSSSDGGWKTNAAGLKFNQNYGFGTINADKLTTEAVKYTGVTPLQTATVGTTSVGASIPDNNSDGVSRTFNIANATRPLEEVLVTLRLTHPYAGDVEAFITSPSGTKSRLVLRNGSDSTNLNDRTWQFATNAFWGENANGQWTLQVRDGFIGDLGTWTSYAITMNLGELIPVSSTTDAEFVSQNVQTTYYARQVYPVSVTMKNTGNTTWVSGTHFLISQNPFNNSTWGRQKVDLPAGVSVAPGENYTFNFNIATPTTGGTYNFQWQMRGNGANFGQLTTNVPINVITGNNAQFISQYAPPSMGPGSKQIVQVIIKNTGSTDWTYLNWYLVSQNPYANNTWGRIKADLNPGETILPGGVKTFNFTVIAPLVEGNYNMQWQMRQGGVQNFGDLTPNQVITVEKQNNADFISQSVPSTMTKGTVQQVSLTFTNNGVTTWTRGSYYLVSQNPYANNTWGKVKVDLNVGESIAPGQSKTFTFNVLAPATAGNYNFQWQMRRAASPKENFGELSTNLVINVTN